MKAKIIRFSFVHLPLSSVGSQPSFSCPLLPARSNRTCFKIHFFLVKAALGEAETGECCTCICEAFHAHHCNPDGSGLHHTTINTAKQTIVYA